VASEPSQKDPDMRLGGRINGDLTVDLPGEYLVETGNFCNLRCPACATGRQELGLSRGFLTAERARSIARNAAPHMKTVGLYNWGELFVNPEYLGIIEAFSEVGAFTTVDTNLVSREFSAQDAEAIVTAGLGRIYASIDGATQAGYEAYRVRGKLDRALANIERLLDARARSGAGNPEIIWKFLVNDLNEHEMMMAQASADALGVPIVYELNNLSRWHPRRRRPGQRIQIERRRYNADFSLKRPPLDGTPLKDLELHDLLRSNFCRQPFHLVVVHWDGRILPCCGVFSDHADLGDLSRQRIEEIWNGEPMRAVRGFVLGYGPPQSGRSVCETARCPVNPKALPPIERLEREAGSREPQAAAE